MVPPSPSSGVTPQAPAPSSKAVLSMAAVALLGLTLGYGLAPSLAAVRPTLPRLAKTHVAPALAPAPLPPAPLPLTPPEETASRGEAPRQVPWLAVTAGAAVLSQPAAAWALANPWSVQLNDVAPTLFAASLFPYLAFLFFLSREEVKLPREALKGFAFLLVFVLATIPAGIYAKTQYGTILANVDWLHGTAESLLTVTNLWTVIGLRQAMPRQPLQPSGWWPPLANPLKKQYRDATFFACAALAFFGVGQAIQSGVWLVEPKNALSLPTWVVHVSSLVEYVAAMNLVWKLSEVQDLPQWRGLTYGMLPLLAGGLTACSFHVFYNNPALNGIVALQALLTLVGNTTCAVAAFRVWQGAKEKARIAEFKEQLTRQLGQDGEGGLGARPPPVPQRLRRPQTTPLLDTDAQWLAKVGATSVLGALAVKCWGLVLGFHVHPEEGLATALALIVLPTVAAAITYARRPKMLPAER